MSEGTHTAVQERGEVTEAPNRSFFAELRRASVPLVPSALISALLAVGIAAASAKVEVPTLIILAGAVILAQCALAAYLVSRNRRSELERRSRELEGFQVALLSALLRTLDMRDRMTARHSAAVARYARELAAAAGMSEEEQELAHTTGLLHDIGKFALPDRILKGSADLTVADWERIREHPYEGARIVSQIDGYQRIGQFILAHHERADGLGYPRGLRLDEIPEIARIIAVVDAYDAMTARDSYRPAVSYQEAVDELTRVAGTQLDPHFVELFVNLMAEKELNARYGEDADFDAELAVDAHIHEYVTQAAAAGTPQLDVSRR